MRKALLLFSVAIFISVSGALAQQPNPGGGDVFNRETEGQDPGTDGPTFSIPGLGPWLFGGQSSKYCGERPRYRGTARPRNIAKGYVTSYTECRSITICLAVDLDAGGVRHRAGDTVTLDLSYASKPTMPSNRPALGQPVNVPFLVEGTKLSATDVLIARTPFPSEARQVRGGSATASVGCQPGEPTPAPNPPQQTRAPDPSRCPSSTLAQAASGPLRRPASGGVPKPQDLRRELEKIVADLDLFWQQQFAAHNMRSLYDGAGPSPLLECAEQNCFYAPTIGADGAFLYNSEVVLDLWRRYGRVAVVGAMAHEFGHKAEFKAKGQFSRDLQRELLATQLAGAYIADLHRRGIVTGDRSFGAKDRDVLRVPRTIGTTISGPLKRG